MLERAFERVADRARRRSCSRCSARPASASRGWCTSSSRARRRARPSCAADASPTARASRSGRSPRSCTPRPASPRPTTSRWRRASSQAPQGSEDDAAGWWRSSPAPQSSGEAARRGAFWAVRTLLEHLARRATARGRHRRHPLGGARLPGAHRASPRLDVGRPDPARAWRDLSCSRTPRMGRREAERDLDPARTPRRTRRPPGSSTPCLGRAEIPAGAAPGSSGGRGEPAVRRAVLGTLIEDGSCGPREASGAPPQISETSRFRRHQRCCSRPGSTAGRRGARRTGAGAVVGQEFQAGAVDGTRPRSPPGASRRGCAPARKELIRPDRAEFAGEDVTASITSDP